MIRCATCGADADDDASFCPACGATVNAGAPVVPVEAPRVGPTFNVQGIGTAIQVLLIIVGVLSVVAIVPSLTLLDRWQRFEDTRTGAMRQEVRDAETLPAVIGLVTFAVTLALFVLFIILAFRMVKNAVAWGGRPRISPGMAIGSWFIPVYFFWGPYVAFADGSAGAEAPHGQPEGPGPKGLIAGWWSAFCLSQIVGFWMPLFLGAGLGARQASGSLSEFSDDTVRTTVSIQQVGIAGLVLAAIAAGLGTLAVKQMTERHTQRIASGL